jgi:hypothetical protein
LRAHSRGELMRGKEVKKGSLGRSPSLPFGPLGAQTIQKGCADRDGMEITRTLIGRDPGAWPDPHWCGSMVGLRELICQSK